MRRQSCVEAYAEDAQAPASSFWSEKEGSLSKVPPCWYSLSHRRPTCYLLVVPPGNCNRAVSLLQAKTGWSTPHGGCSPEDGG